MITGGRTLSVGGAAVANSSITTRHRHRTRNTVDQRHLCVHVDVDRVPRNVSSEHPVRRCRAHRAPVLADGVSTASAVPRCFDRPLDTRCFRRIRATDEPSAPRRTIDVEDAGSSGVGLLPMSAVPMSRREPRNAASRRIRRRRRGSGRGRCLRRRVAPERRRAAIAPSSPAGLCCDDRRRNRRVAPSRSSHSGAIIGTARPACNRVWCAPLARLRLFTCSGSVPGFSASAPQISPSS